MSSAASTSRVAATRIKAPAMSARRSWSLVLGPVLLLLGLLAAPAGAAANRMAAECPRYATECDGSELGTGGTGNLFDRAGTQTPWRGTITRRVVIPLQDQYKYHGTELQEWHRSVEGSLEETWTFDGTGEVWVVEDGPLRGLLAFYQDYEWSFSGEETWRHRSDDGCDALDRTQHYSGSARFTPDFDEVDASVVEPLVLTPAGADNRYYVATGLHTGLDGLDTGDGIVPVEPIDEELVSRCGEISLVVQSSSGAIYGESERGSFRSGLGPLVIDGDATSITDEFSYAWHDEIHTVIVNLTREPVASGSEGGGGSNTPDPDVPDGVAPVGPVDDVSGHTHEVTIWQLIDLEIASGYPDGSFRPDAPVTRGQMATFISRALERAPVAQAGVGRLAASGFSDVAGDPHAASIATIVEQGIASGYPDGTFRPGESVTRGQMATFLIRAFELPVVPGASGFSDVPVGASHGESIAAIVEAGITSGYPDGTYRPAAQVTRGQMATFLVRALGVV